jgi:hypothetical protein
MSGRSPDGLLPFAEKEAVLALVGWESGFLKTPRRYWPRFYSSLSGLAWGQERTSLRTTDISGVCDRRACALPAQSEQSNADRRLLGMRESFPDRTCDDLALPLDRRL